MEENKIEISKYCYFDTEHGRFFLTDEGSNLIYRGTGVICSYSGANEWCNHFMCELIDLYSGASKYNYSLGSTVHETEIPRIWKDNKEGILEWLNKSKEAEWFKAVVELFDITMQNLPDHN